MPKYVFQCDFFTRAVLRFYVARFLRETMQFSVETLDYYLQGKVTDLYFLQEVKRFCDKKEGKK